MLVSLRLIICGLPQRGPTLLAAVIVCSVVYLPSSPEVGSASFCAPWLSLAGRDLVVVCRQAYPLEALQHFLEGLEPRGTIDDSLSLGG